MASLVSSAPAHRPRIAGLAARFVTALAVRRSRSVLADLPDHILADIGRTRAEAEAEARRQFWDVPERWRG